MSMTPLTAANDAGCVLISGIDIVGDVTVPIDVEMQGRLNGTLRAPNVRLATTARVTGTIIANEIDVYGSVEDGALIANRIRLRAGCDVDADLYYRQLDIDEGALFEGKTRRHDDPQSLAPPPAAD